MIGQIYKRCTRCPKRCRYKKGEEECRACGATEVAWYYLVDIGPDPATGKRRRKNQGGFEHRKEAEEALRKVLEKVDGEGFVEPSTLSVAAFLQQQWLPAMQLTAERTTLDGYEGIVSRYVVPRIGQIALGDLTPPKLNWLYADVRDNGRTHGQGKLSLKTVREVHVVLHRAFADAVRWGYLETNPCDRANAPSATAAKNGRKKAIQTWTAEQVNQFGAQIADHPFFGLWLLAASTGMRRSELLGLRWKDIDADRRMLAIRQVLVKVGGTAELKDAPKTKHGWRTIRFAPRVARALAELRHRQVETRMAAESWHDHDLVFCRDDGMWFHPDYVTETIRELIAASGLPRIRPLQDMRHTHATLLMGAAGVNTKIVQERLGHHSYAFTADTYQHVMPGMDEAATAEFDGLVFGPEEPGEEPGEEADAQ